MYKRREVHKENARIKENKIVISHEEAEGNWAAKGFTFRICFLPQ
jgi:hypothetical protein